MTLLHVSESKKSRILDSTRVDSLFQVLDSNLCQWNLDSRFQSLVGFRIPNPRHPDSTSNIFPGIQIPQAKISRVPASGFPDMGRDLHLCAPSALRACPSGTYGDLLKSPLLYPRVECLTNLDLHKLTDIQRGGHHKCFSALLFKTTAAIQRNGIP